MTGAGRKVGVRPEGCGLGRRARFGIRRSADESDPVQGKSLFSNSEAGSLPVSVSHGAECVTPAWAQGARRRRRHPPRGPADGEAGVLRRLDGAVAGGLRAPARPWWASAARAAMQGVRRRRDRRPPGRAPRPGRSTIAARPRAVGPAHAHRPSPGRPRRGERPERAGAGLAPRLRRHRTVGHLDGLAPPRRRGRAPGPPRGPRLVPGPWAPGSPRGPLVGPLHQPRIGVGMKARQGPDAPGGARRAAGIPPSQGLPPVV